MTLPDFFVIGAPDAGSAALHEELGRHPGLFTSEIAEPGYFLAGSAGRGDEPGPPGWSELAVTVRRADYEALFDAAPPGAIRGESTPYYLADFRALRRMHELLPYAKMIVLLRDPVERAHAHWIRMRRAGLEAIDGFERALAAEPARTAAGWAWPWRYLALGRYGAQLQRLHTLFARQQVLLVGHRDLAADPAGVARRVSGFLGVNRGDPGAMSGVGSTIRPAELAAGRPALMPATADFLDRATLAAFRPPPRRADDVPTSTASGGGVRPGADGPERGGPEGDGPEFGVRLDRAVAERVRESFRSDILLLTEVTGRRFDGWLSDGDRWA